MILNLELRGIFLIVSLFLSYPYLDEEYRRFIKIRDVNFWIIILVYVMYLIIIRIDINYKLRINFMLIILLFIIIVRDLVIFFFLYEIVFVLILFAIILLGYRYERLLASFLIIFYSFIFSSPRLLIILLFDHRFLIKSWLFYRIVLCYFLIGSFIVKFPIFGFHYWLPIAHVEASTVGSIVLAGLLLKLGSVGLLYIVIYINFIIKLHWIGIRVVILILMILRLRDLKIIIAYSSVAHIRIIFYVLMLGRIVGKKGSIYIIFYHGFISPLIFWLVGMLAWWKTRSLIVVKLLSFSYIFILCLFILFIINIGFPPFIGFLREILILKSLIRSKLILIIMILSVLFSCYYNIYLLWCFTGFIGMVYKINFYRIDLFIFMLLVLVLRF